MMEYRISKGYLGPRRTFNIILGMEPHKMGLTGPFCWGCRDSLHKGL